MGGRMIELLVIFNIILAIMIITFAFIHEDILDNLVRRLDEQDSCDRIKELSDHVDSVEALEKGESPPERYIYVPTVEE